MNRPNSANTAEEDKIILRPGRSMRPIAIFCILAGCGALLARFGDWQFTLQEWVLVLGLPFSIFWLILASTTIVIFTQEGICRSWQIPGVRRTLGHFCKMLVRWDEVLQVGRMPSLKMVAIVGLNKHGEKLNIRAGINVGRNPENMKDGERQALQYLLNKVDPDILALFGQEKA